MRGTELSRPESSLVPVDLSLMRGKANCGASIESARWAGLHRVVVIKLVKILVEGPGGHLGEGVIDL